ncbi:hypothetical protein V2W45_1019373 [Cenococcum geophilum]
MRTSLRDSDSNLVLVLALLALQQTILPSNRAPPVPLEQAVSGTKWPFSISSGCFAVPCRLHSQRLHPTAFEYQICSLQHPSYSKALVLSWTTASNKQL